VLRDQGYRTFQRAVMNERETMVEWWSAEKNQRNFAEKPTFQIKSFGIEPGTAE
jgi:hypothetical protein